MKFFILLSLSVFSLGVFAQDGLEARLNAEMRAQQREAHRKAFVASKIVDSKCSKIIVHSEKSCNGGFFNSDNINYTCILKAPYRKRILTEVKEAPLYVNITSEEKSVDYSYQADCQEVLSKFYL